MSQKSVEILNEHAVLDVPEVRRDKRGKEDSLDVEDEALEVLAFGVVDVDGMVGGLVELIEDADTAADLGGSAEDCEAEVVLGDHL